MFRLIWGFVGPQYARFPAFVAGPRATFQSLKALVRREPSAHIGHSPIGGWSTMLLLTLVGIQVSTGLFIDDDIFFAGPYNGVISGDTAGLLAKIHHTNFNVLQFAVVLHLCAISWYAWGKRTNLVTPMITGRKQLSEEQASQPIASSMILRAIVVAGLVAAVVTLLVQLAPPPPVEDYF